MSLRKLGTEKGCKQNKAAIICHGENWELNKVAKVIFSGYKQNFTLYTGRPKKAMTRMYFQTPGQARSRDLYMSVYIWS